jgi:hypothetical protein
MVQLGAGGMTWSREELNKRFDYHAPTGNEGDTHEWVRARLKETASAMLTMLPDGRELSLVVTHLEEAMFWANAALARSEAYTAALPLRDAEPASPGPE